MCNHNRSMKSRTCFALAIVGAYVLIGSSQIHAQQRRMSVATSPRSSHIRFAGSPFYPANGAGPTIHREHPENREHRHTRVVPVCIGAVPEAWPDYGFDFEHLSALNADPTVKAAIDPATRLQLNEIERLGCTNVAPLGYFATSDGYIVPDEDNQSIEGAAGPEPQPQIVILQQAQPSPATETTKPASAVAAEPPPPDEGEFVLVLRDGRQLQAVAFTRDEDKVVYVTTEGTRHVMPLSDLDSEATIRVNEERGTPVECSF